MTQRVLNNSLGSAGALAAATGAVGAAGAGAAAGSAGLAAGVAVDVDSCFEQASAATHSSVATPSLLNMLSPSLRSSSTSAQHSALGLESVGPPPQTVQSRPSGGPNSWTGNGSESSARGGRGGRCAGWSFRTDPVVHTCAHFESGCAHPCASFHELCCIDPHLSAWKLKLVLQCLWNWPRPDEPPRRQDARKRRERDSKFLLASWRPLAVQFCPPAANSSTPAADGVNTSESSPLAPAAASQRTCASLPARLDR